MDGLIGLFGAAAVDAPATAVGDDADFLDVEVDHVAWPASMDTTRCAVGFAGGVEEPASVQVEVSQVAAHGPDSDHGSFALQVENDATG